ncbi:MAG: hypothetical protein VYD83_05635, partial [SAR324 cluster bacterium]|nr:hypothetical protein [SAR324 cluster bacterium]
MKVSAGIKANNAGVLKTEKIAVIPPLRAQLATPTQITKEIKTIAKKYVLAGIREASPNRNSINGNSKFPTLPNIAIRTNAAETYFDWQRA